MHPTAVVRSETVFLAFAAVVLTATRATYAAEDGPTVRVSIPAASTSHLEKRVGERWEPLCAAPCGIDVPAGTTVRVVDDGGHELRQFVLADPGAAEIEISDAAWTQRRVGTVMSAVGGAAIVPAVAIALVGFVGCFTTVPYFCDSPLTHDANQALGHPAVWGSAVGGLAVLALGVGLTMSASSPMLAFTPAGVAF